VHHGLKIAKILKYMHYFSFFIVDVGPQGHDFMVVGFITTYAISAYHQWCSELESRSGEVYFYVIKFVSDLLQVDGFF
jgi:hypothetical protein